MATQAGWRQRVCGLIAVIGAWGCATARTVGGPSACAEPDGRIAQQPRLPVHRAIDPVADAAWLAFDPGPRLVLRQPYSVIACSDDATSAMGRYVLD